MPVTFENGTWVVLTDLKDIEINEQIMARISYLMQQKLVALGDLVTVQPYQSVLVSEHKTSPHSDLIKREKEKKMLMIPDVDLRMSDLRSDILKPTLKATQSRTPE